MARVIVNKRQLADIVGVSERTLTEWQDGGLPIELVGGRGVDNQYETAKVIEWMVQRALAGQKSETGRERLDRLQAQKLEMDIAEQAGLLVSTQHIEPMLTDAIVAARGELLALSERLKGKLDALYRINMDPAIVEGEVLVSLKKLSDLPMSNLGVVRANSEHEEGGADA